MITYSYQSDGFEIQPPLTNAQMTELTAFLESHDPDELFECNMQEIAFQEGADLPVWELEEILEKLLSEFFRYNGLLVTGTASFQSDNSEALDKGGIFIKDSILEIVSDITWNSGPSWDPKPLGEDLRIALKSRGISV